MGIRYPSCVGAKSRIPFGLIGSSSFVPGVWDSIWLSGSMMAERVIAIGDIHGCAEALYALLEIVDPTSADVIVALGDYVDRGPQSREVIDQVMEMSKLCEFVPLAGNHELMMLDALSNSDAHEIDFWLHCGGEETMASYGLSLIHI